MNNINNNNNKNTRITYKDNIKILKYYNIDIPKSRKAIKKKTDEILSSKLCRCIKKLGTDYESRSIGICTRTIFNSKKLRAGPISVQERILLIKLKKRKSFFEIDLI